MGHQSALPLLLVLFPSRGTVDLRGFSVGCSLDVVHLHIVNGLCALQSRSARNVRIAFFLCVLMREALELRGFLGEKFPRFCRFGYHKWRRFSSLYVQHSSPIASFPACSPVVKPFTCMDFLHMAPRLCRRRSHLVARRNCLGNGYKFRGYAALGARDDNTSKTESPVVHHAWFCSLGYEVLELLPDAR